MTAQPFAGLAFKIMNDPFVGSLTFTRIYSGQVKKGDQLLNSTKGKRERIGRMIDDARQQPEEIDGGLRGRHHRAGGPQGHDHGRHALRSERTRSSSRR